ncbi:MAG: DUF3445 domain-containing protein [Phenylobacterium sp.]
MAGPKGGAEALSLRHAPWEEAADFAIGLKPVAAAAWLEGGEAEPWRRKDPLIATHPAMVWAEDAASRPAQAEALAMVEAALATSAGRPDLPPLLAAARLVPDDLVLMERRDRAWRVRALSLCAPTFFTADRVAGKSLAELHDPVDGFAERFLSRVARIFEGLRPDLILERRNWTLTNGDEPFAPDPAPIRAQIGDIAPERAGEALFLRVERQTIRRLPASGAVLFTIRVWLSPLSAVAAEPVRLAAFARAWRSATPAFRAYKQLNLYGGLVEAFLRACGESGALDASGAAV